MARFKFIFTLKIVGDCSRMNHVFLDTISLAGFSYDFGTLSGNKSDITAVFDSVGSKTSFIDAALFLLSLIVPAFVNVATVHHSMLKQLAKTLRTLGDKFLATTGDMSKDKSVIGLLGT
ncbi:hypothetical protein DFH08DRAFT_952666 [Mycena albidolilacea]|uniref:Uncharacterized protein n=1 Tax=Mycena albidolilacea TaxID=1033008 RepID=A0AAD7EZ89_9AGAR|nr:hypothetical protein DFH08DRAFT_952666 [Mycena albidolilacea]